MKITFAGALALLACALCACAADGTDDGNKTEQSTNEPTLWRGNATVPGADDPQATDDRRDLSNALGAGARNITYNHPTPHELTIPARDFVKGRGGAYEMTAGGGAFGELHTHTVTLTAQEVGEILDGAELTFESSVGGANPHTHTVTIGKR